MKALCWHGRSDVRYEEVPDPSIIDPTDAIVRITSTAICGSDLHLYDGFNPSMMRGDVLGRAHGHRRGGGPRGASAEGR